MESTINNILVTGSAGFIGFHITTRLLNEGYSVWGLDCISDYYSTSLKYSRLALHGISEDDIVYNKVIQSRIYPKYKFIKLKLEDKKNIDQLFHVAKFDAVIHLAAQAGVRYSITNPDSYINSNVIGFLNILEGCRRYPVKHLVYASSSSVYGMSDTLPLSTGQNTDHPVSLYAATKKSDELMAYTYSHLYKIPSTGLRFFTVYGPYGRPDMAFFSFTKNIIEDKPIKIFNNGVSLRDFTYIDDIVEGIFRVVFRPPLNTEERTDPLNPLSKLYNIGNGNPVKLMDFIHAIEKALNKKAIKEYLPEQPGDVFATHADMTEFIRDFDFRPSTSFQLGISKFVTWYREYFEIDTGNGKKSLLIPSCGL
jgi:UDP-glucuronate 4-epimerase